jgi:hypothetical protein
VGSASARDRRSHLGTPGPVRQPPRTPGCADARLLSPVDPPGDALRRGGGTGGGGGGPGGPGHHRVGSSVSDRDPGLLLGSGAVERGVARLFRAKAKITGAVKFTQARTGARVGPCFAVRESGEVLAHHTRSLT